MMETEILLTLVFSPRLASRQDGGLLRLQLNEELRQSHTVVLNFDGVRLLSPSFANQCFFSLATEWPLPFLREHLILKRASPSILALIRYNLLEGSRQPKTA